MFRATAIRNGLLQIIRKRYFLISFLVEYFVFCSVMWPYPDAWLEFVIYSVAWLDQWFPNAAFIALMVAMPTGIGWALAAMKKRGIIQLKESKPGQFGEALFFALLFITILAAISASLSTNIYQEHSIGQYKTLVKLLAFIGMLVALFFSFEFHPKMKCNNCGRPMRLVGGGWGWYHYRCEWCSGQNTRK